MNLSSLRMSSRVPSFKPPMRMAGRRQVGQGHRLAYQSHLRAVVMVFEFGECPCIRTGEHGGSR